MLVKSEKQPHFAAFAKKISEKRDGLMPGICSGFQALMKFGLVLYEKMIDTDANCPTLRYNVIERRRAKMGHAEHIGKNLCRNVPGGYDMDLFRSAAKYFK